MKGSRVTSVKAWYLLTTGLVLLVAVAAPASAQKTYALGIGGGVAIPAAKFADTRSTGYNATVSLAIGSGDVPIGLRVDGIYNHFSGKDVASAQTAATTGANIVGGLVDLIFAFPGTTAKAYVIAGAGYYNTKIQGSGLKADNNLGFNGGVGVTFGAGPIAMFLETRYHSISRSAAKGGVIQFVPVTLGLLF